MKNIFWTLLLTITLTHNAIATPISDADEQGRQKVTIYLVRHGKTLLNTADRVQGWIDSPLTPEGVRVARELGEGLKKIKFDSYYTSDAGRQRETLGVILRQAGVNSWQDNELTGLREVWFGSFEGGPNATMARACARQLGLRDETALYQAMKAGQLTVDKTQNALAKADPQGTTENYRQVKTRTQAALNTIINNALRRGDKNVLVISSGMAIQIMISSLTDDPAKNRPLANASVVKIIYQNGKYTLPEIGVMHYVNDGRRLLAQTDR